jgi:signal transduction histidine kinase
MPALVFDEMKRYLGFDDEDARALRALAGPLEPHVTGIVARFYERVVADPGTRAVLSAELAELPALKRTLADWLRGLFAGDYGEAYHRKRAQIGRAHVRAGLPQHYMVAAMELVRLELEAAIGATAVRGKRRKIAALRRLLALELGLMLETYRESYAQTARQGERDAMEARLRETEKLAQIGQLSAALAHEIKNPLAGISGAIQIIRGSLKPGQPHWSVLGEVLQQINRLDRTVKDLLVYARPKPPRLGRCDLSAVIERLLGLLRKEPAGARIHLEHHAVTPVPTIMADANQIEQLLMNLLLNAVQASDENSTVRVSTSADNAHIRLVVTDRGCGMEAEEARRALEPFFTTKARGTGLGLPICQKIVEAHDGQIVIDSTPGTGSEVTVTLPLRPSPRETAERP